MTAAPYLNPWQKIVRGLTDISLAPCRESEVANFYWCSEINTTEISAAYFDGRHTNTFISHIGPAVVVGKTCSECGGPVYVFSRQEASDGVGRRRNSFDRCKQCVRKRIEEGSSAFAAEMRLRDQRRSDLRRMPYRDYLQTPEWKATREQALKRARYCCQTCASGGELHVHHRTYVRRGEEYSSDLIVLCADCHQIFHENGRLADGGRSAANDRTPSKAKQSEAAEL